MKNIKSYNLFILESMHITPTGKLVDEDEIKKEDAKAKLISLLELYNDCETRANYTTEYSVDEFGFIEELIKNLINKKFKVYRNPGKDFKPEEYDILIGTKLEPSPIDIYLQGKIWIGFSILKKNYNTVGWSEYWEAMNINEHPTIPYKMLVIRKL